MEKTGEQREKLSSRLGFILLAAGCAIGLGNIWRFPSMVGQYGGGLFVLMYIIFLGIFGAPILVMELGVGRASRKNLVGAYRDLANKKKNVWAGFGKIFFAGNAILMMFYTTVSGWMLAYTYFYANGTMEHVPVAEIGQFFNNFIADPLDMIIFMMITILIGTLVCAMGLKNGVENFVKYMMLLLLLILVGLAIYCCSLDGAAAGLKFYLYPSLENIQEHGLLRVITEALGQAFFTLSIGVGSMEIYGSYIAKTDTLTKESLFIIIVDTFVALLAGAIIFPACATYGVNPGAGPGLIFNALPNVFSQMKNGILLAILFFGFMSLAALTTVIAVMENLIAYLMDEKHLSRLKASAYTGIGLVILSLPCALGFNVLKNIQPLGKGSTILDLEDFIISNNLLVFGTVFLIIFCCSKSGWGYENFIAEIDTGKGIKFPKRFKLYYQYVIPTIILVLGVIMYYSKFFQV